MRGPGTEHPMAVLSPSVIDELKPQERRFDVPIEDDFVISVLPNGIKTWVFVYAQDGRAQRRTLGVYPDMGLEDARASLEAARATRRSLQEASERARAAAARVEMRAAQQRPRSSSGLTAILVAAALVGAGATYFGLRLLGARTDGVATTTAATDAAPVAAEPVQGAGTALTSPPPPVIPATTVGDGATEDSAPVTPAVVATAQATEEAAPATPEVTGKAPQVTPEAREPDDAAPATGAAASDATSVAAATPASEPAAEREVVPAARTEVVPAAEPEVAPAEPEASREMVAVASTPSAAAAPDPPPRADTESRAVPVSRDASHVARAQLASNVVRLEPVDSLSGEITGVPGGVKQVFFYTELRGLAGKRVTYRWEHEGQLEATVPITVGGSWRWRTYSRKELLPDKTGEWRVQLVDDAGAVLAEAQFVYRNDAPGEQSASAN
jgi:hypothetical protein